MEAEADIRSYLEHSVEYFRLTVFKIVMRYVTGTVQFLLIGAGILFVILFCRGRPLWPCPKFWIITTAVLFWSAFST